MAGEPLRPPAGWQLRQFDVCGSTEDELDAWLGEPATETVLPDCGLAVVAAQQLRGRGQWGRPWVSPPGGLWLSAAMSWPAFDGAPLTLAAAVGLALQLETLGLSPQIKWPNDLLLDGRKLAGVLSRLRLAGSRVRWAQVGVGLNGSNGVPTGAIALAERLDPEQVTAAALLPRVLAGLDWARQQALEPQRVLQLANLRLYKPTQGLMHQGQCWQVAGLGHGGSLLLERPGQQLELRGMPQPGSNLSPESPS